MLSIFGRKVGLSHEGLISCDPRSKVIGLCARKCAFPGPIYVTEVRYGVIEDR